MLFEGFPKDGLRFLKDLAKHNDRTWFKANKKRFDEALLDPARRLVTALGERLAAEVPGLTYDPKINGSITRMARDTRFSKDKRPFKEHLILRFRTGAKNGPAFWFRLHPTFLGVGAGVHAFDDKTLKAYRRAVDDGKTGPKLAAALKALAPRKGYGLMGLHYKRVPRGFDADHPREELLRHNGLFAYLEDKIPPELHTPRLVPYCLKRYLVLRPVHDWLAAL